MPFTAEESEPFVGSNSQSNHLKRRTGPQVGEQQRWMLDEPFFTNDDGEVVTVQLLVATDSSIFFVVYVLVVEGTLVPNFCFAHLTPTGIISLLFLYGR